MEWTGGGNLSEACWNELRTINLHWHDLRLEALSRLGESSELSDHELMEIAGHANLTTTQRYLNTEIERLKQGVLELPAQRLAQPCETTHPDGLITHRRCRLIWKILHHGIQCRDRGPAVSKEAKQARARKMIRELRSLGYRVELASHTLAAE